MNVKQSASGGAILALLLAVGAAACADDDNAATGTTDTTDAAAAVPEVGTTEPSVDSTQPPEATEPPSTSDAEDAMTDSSEPPTSTPCPAEPTVESAGDVVVGLTPEEATVAAEDCGWILRVVRIDGEDQPVTRDLRPNRVNVEVTDGEVTAVVNIG
jgi:hypothetical protein